MRQTVSEPALTILWPALFPLMDTRATDDPISLAVVAATTEIAAHSVLPATHQNLRRCSVQLSSRSGGSTGAAGTDMKRFPYDCGLDHDGAG